MPSNDLDIKAVTTYLAGLSSKLDELGRHL
jgi:hypothetical protein